MAILCCSRLYRAAPCPLCGPRLWYLLRRHRRLYNCVLRLIVLVDSGPAPDRLARNYVHQMVLLEELERHGCQVEFLERPMSHDPHDQLLLAIHTREQPEARSLAALARLLGAALAPRELPTGEMRQRHGHAVACPRPTLLPPSSAYFAVWTQARLNANGAN